MAVQDTLRRRPERTAFEKYLRTGRSPFCDPSSVEYKFNPYHDPRNGQFTFAPGGPRSLDRVIMSRRRSLSADDGFNRENAGGAREAFPAAVPAYAPGGPGQGRTGSGGNSRAFHDPMTLEQVFPGLRNTPGGSIIAVADGFFNFTGPANALRAELTKKQATALIKQIRDVDPNYRFQSFGFPQTVEG
ncbi:hypothetical protein [Sphingomonas sp. M1-B02]|uniref:hypothetical protein n=1 Tax=Sphingomonas sp. M1-B02 TaxID=3114300 RepID=UPI00223EFC0A|nr:hypothetical protein [Sphingomonas sp. S6-11]UZK66386.1 hypothetical protein OKW87_00660 [Sphingomonas sp. S6-11]